MVERSNGDSVAPPGWYPYADGIDAFWDGSRWTQHTRPRIEPAPPPPSYSQPPAVPAAGGAFFTPAVMIGLGVGVLLLLALFPLPYSYYQFLRAAVTAGAIALTVFAVRSHQTGWIIFGVIAALLFNPLFPITATRGFWAPVDLIAAVLFVVAGFRIQQRT